MILSSKKLPYSFRNGIICCWGPGASSDGHGPGSTSGDTGAGVGGDSSGGNTSGPGPGQSDDSSIGYGVDGLVDIGSPTGGMSNIGDAPSGTDSPMSIGGILGGILGGIMGLPVGVLGVVTGAASGYSMGKSAEAVASDVMGFLGMDSTVEGIVGQFGVSRSEAQTLSDGFNNMSDGEKNEMFREATTQAQATTDYADPMSIFDTANKSLSQYSGTPLEQSTQAGIAAQEEQRDKVIGMFQPYYDSAIKDGLPTLQALAQGGEVDYTPSKLYDYSKKLATRNINRTQAAKGKLLSSGTKEMMADMNVDLAKEDMDRFSAGALSQVQLGTSAADIMSSAGASSTGVVGSLYSNLGTGANIQAVQEGSAKQSAYQGMASSLKGLSQYMEAG